jgi:hypothetical protein
VQADWLENYKEIAKPAGPKQKRDAEPFYIPFLGKKPGGLFLLVFGQGGNGLRPTEKLVLGQVSNGVDAEGFLQVFGIGGAKALQGINGGLNQFFQRLAFVRFVYRKIDVHTIRGVVKCSLKLKPMPLKIRAKCFTFRLLKIVIL